MRQLLQTATTLLQNATFFTNCDSAMLFLLMRTIKMTMNLCNVPEVSRKRGKSQFEQPKYRKPNLNNLTDLDQVLRKSTRNHF